MNPVGPAPSPQPSQPPTTFSVLTAKDGTLLFGVANGSEPSGITAADLLPLQQTGSSLRSRPGRPPLRARLVEHEVLRRRVLLLLPAVRTRTDQQRAGRTGRRASGLRVLKRQHSRRKRFLRYGGCRKSLSARRPPSSSAASNAPSSRSEASTATSWSGTAVPSRWSRGKGLRDVAAVRWAGEANMRNAGGCSRFQALGDQGADGVQAVAPGDLLALGLGAGVVCDGQLA